MILFVNNDFFDKIITYFDQIDAFGIQCEHSVHFRIFSVGYNQSTRHVVNLNGHAFSIFDVYLVANAVDDEVFFVKVVDADGGLEVCSVRGRSVHYDMAWVVGVTIAPIGKRVVLVWRSCNGDGYTIIVHAAAAGGTHGRIAAVDGDLILLWGKVCGIGGIAIYSDDPWILCVST